MEVGRSQRRQLYSRSYDLDGRLVAYPLGRASGLVRTLVYDAGSRITNYMHSGPASASGLDQTFAYDAYDRLTSSAVGGVTTTYTYDANGNRTSSTPPSASFMIDGASNRLTATTQLPARGYGYDAMGNVTGAGEWQYSYGDDKRLAQATAGTTVVHYWYDGNGHRVAQQGAALRYYAYDEAGQTIGEYWENAVIEETVYLGDLPVAVLGHGVNYVFADHLNAPRVLEDDGGNVTGRGWIPIRLARAARPQVRPLPNTITGPRGRFSMRDRTTLQLLPRL